MSVETRPEDQSIDLGAMLGALLARWPRILIVTLVALGVTFAFLLFVPKMYESTAGLLVEQRANPAGTQQVSSSPSIPVEAMMSSQIELIKSRDTLRSVIDTENLRSVPEFTGAGFSAAAFVMQLLGRQPEQRSIDETVLQNLNERLTVARERDSAVISINVLSEDAQLAARLANAIAAAHVRRRTDLSLSDTAEASEWLQQEIARLRIKVQEAEAAVANYRVENDLFTGANSTSILNEQLTAISSQITAAQERKNAAQSRANLIRELVAQGQALDGIQDVRNSVAIQQLSQSKANLQGELAQRSSTLLPNHPTIKALVAQIGVVEGQIAAEARRVADALEAEARIESDLEASLRDELVRAKISVSNATRDSVTLEELQREARAHRELLEAYLLRYSDASSRTEVGSALPDVRQITLAAPSVEPASPKTSLILGAVGFVSVALQIGGILFGELMSGRALTTRYTFAPATARESDEVDDEPVAIADLFDQPREEDDETVEDGEPDAVRAFLAADPDAFEPATTREPALPPAEPHDQHSEPDLAPPEATRAVGDLPPAGRRQHRSQQEAERHASATAAGENALELSNLSADIAIGRVRTVMLAALSTHRDCEVVAETLIADALRRGLSVVRIDAGSGRVSTEPGLTDLAADRASFGDVVHRVRDGLAEVPWGHQAALERRSMRPATLVEALGDIYEVVIVTTGRIGVASALPTFTGLPCRLVLVGDAPPDRRTVEAAIEDAANLGYEIGQIVYAPQSQPEVA
jgi:polysaccharide biosynthesis transport protein